jgi:hypothetical protein
MVLCMPALWGRGGAATGTRSQTTRQLCPEDTYLVAILASLLAAFPSSLRVSVLAAHWTHLGGYLKKKNPSSQITPRIQSIQLSGVQLGICTL